MLRQALIALALAFTASTLYGCGGLSNAVEAGKYLNDHCSEKLTPEFDALKADKADDACGGHKDSVAKAVQVGYRGKCIKHISSEEGKEMLSFNKSDNDFPEQIDLFIQNNSAQMKTDFDDACAKADEAGSHAANMSAQAHAKVDEAKDTASAKLDEAKDTASAKLDEAKDAASEKADEAQAAVSEHADKAKAELDKHTGGGDGGDGADSDDEAASSSERLFEVVQDVDGEKGKSASTSLVVLAGAGMCLAVLGVVVSVRMHRQRTSPEDMQLVDSEANIE